MLAESKTAANSLCLRFAVAEAEHDSLVYAAR